MKFYTISLALLFSLSLLSQDTLTGCLILDFEEIEGVSLFEGLELSDQFEASFGLSFELEGGGFPVLAEVGGSSPFAFGSAFGSDTPNPIDADLVGNYFLTDDGIYIDENSPPIILNFSTPIDSFSGCILDMDGGEIFFIEAFGEFGDVILQDSIEAGDPNTGDGRATCWGFSFGNCIGMVHQIKFTGTRPNSVFGLGLDYFSFCYAGINEAQEFVICEGDSIEVNNEIYTEAGTYEQQFTTAQGCDSLVYIVLDVLPSYEEQDSYTICEGSSIIVDGIEYEEPGEYPQMYQTIDGCDSLVNILINVLPFFNTIESFSICPGETIVINGENYDSGGVYTQVLIANNGCDSTLQIQIEEFPEFEIFIIEEICQGETYELNNESFESTGIYEFNLTSTNGCDSIVVLDLLVNQIFDTTFNASICDNESYEFNGVIYQDPGTYSFDLETTSGCDSTVVLNLEVLAIPESFQSYTIFEGESIIVNGEEYFTQGNYAQVLLAGNGCDSLVNIELLVLPPPNPETVVFYDLENCAAGNGYQEMTASYPSPLDCVALDASIISRINGFEHSCTSGAESNLAMCVSSMPSCEYIAASDYKLAFNLEIDPQDGKAFVMSSFSFFEQAPEIFTWATGGTGPNNYPTLFGIRILWNGTEIFLRENEETNLNWTQQVFDFAGLPDFRFEENGVLSIELLPYCVIGSFSTVTAWDIDQLSINGYCSNISSSVFGRITSSNGNIPMSNIQVTLNGNYNNHVIESNDNGLYAFDNLTDNYEYRVHAFYDNEVMNGVSTLDLILMQKHILQIKPFTKHAQFIAADINKSNSISALDLIELRKLILGIHHKFPNNTSWRFFDEKQLVTSPWDKDESIVASSENDESLDFEGIKIGDVDFSNKNYYSQSTSVRSSKQTSIQTKIETIPNSENSLIHFIATEKINVSGMQLNLGLNTFEFVRLVSGKLNIDNGNMYAENNSIKISWNDSDTVIKNNQVLFSLIVKNELNNINLIDDEFQDAFYAINELDEIEIVEIEIVNRDIISSFVPIDFNVFPNPSKDLINISFNTDSKENFNIKVISVDGKTLQSFSYDTLIGLNTIELDLVNLDLNDGLFYLKISGEKDFLIKRILKL